MEHSDSEPDIGYKGFKQCDLASAGQKAAKGRAVGSGAAALAMILGAVAAAFGGKVGERAPRRDSDSDEVQTPARNGSLRRA